MIQELKMQNFKSFAAQRGTIRLGGLSLIIGTNASGKSNIRDGLRFIHGISRGYSIAEIIGEKYGEEGVLQWKGIRGGVKETVLRNGNANNTKFTIDVTTKLAEADGGGIATYSITVDVGDKTRTPTVANEALRIGPNDKDTFQWKAKAGPGQMEVYLRRSSSKKTLGPSHSMRNDRPALTQVSELDASYDTEVVSEAQKECKAFLRSISSVRFLDLDPQALRRPAIPGQTILGDKGENLSSVLQAICGDTQAKDALIEWTRELTPLDVADLKFPEVSLEGKIQLQIVEAGGREISAESASDGTLRFLAFAAALLGTDPARFYFFEEIENGIHPNRAHLLINLLRNSTRKGEIQVAGTTHSPALLNFLDEASLRDSSLVYRAGSISKIRSLGDIAALWQVAATSRAGELHGSGWFENIAAYLEAEENP
jgi:predicted ATPase